MTEQEILDNKPNGSVSIDNDGDFFNGSGVMWDDLCKDFDYHDRAEYPVRSIADIETIVSLRAEIESLKTQLEAKNKAPSHWDTAPEGAVKLVNCNGYHIYLNSNDEYFDCEIGCWNKDSNPEDNTLIDELTL